MPHLHSDLPVALTTANASLEGVRILADPASPVHSGALAAVFGWSSFGFEAATLAAVAVAIRLSPFGAARRALSRGSERAQRAGASLPPLVGALDLRRHVGYWSNITEEGAGWMAKVTLSDARSGTYWPVSDSRLASHEQALFRVAPIATFESPLYSRPTPTSEIGHELPNVLPSGLQEPSTASSAMDALLKIEYSL